jgi:hypothetical protein
MIPSCMVEKPHPDGLCGKSVVVINNSSEYISPGDGTCPTRFHSGCWSLLVDPRMGWRKHTRLACEVALEVRTYVVFFTLQGGLYKEVEPSINIRDLWGLLPIFLITSSKVLVSG